MRGNTAEGAERISVYYVITVPYTISVDCGRESMVYYPWNGSGSDPEKKADLDPAVHAA